MIFDGMLYYGINNMGKVDRVNFIEYDGVVFDSQYIVFRINLVMIFFIQYKIKYNVEYNIFFYLIFWVRYSIWGGYIGVCFGIGGQGVDFVGERVYVLCGLIEVEIFAVYIK